MVSLAISVTSLVGLTCWTEISGEKEKFEEVTIMPELFMVDVVDDNFQRLPCDSLCKIYA